MTRPTPPPAAGIQDAARHLAEARTDEAVAVLERLIADFPAYVTAHVLLAKAYEASGRANGALEAWHRAYFLMPGSPLIIRERTRLLRSVPVEDEPATPVAPAPAADFDEAPMDEAPADNASWSEEEGADMVEAADAIAEAESHAEPEPDDEPDDLDTLIRQIENAPRIRPDAHFKDDAVEEEEDDDDEMVSETLARIYEAQKQYDAAAHAYEQLADQRPERATELLSKAAELRRLAAGSGN
ncbi:MAG: tetratricopeptide repeat protein [Rhodothermales bacterium]